MDFLKKGADMLNKNKDGGSAQQQNTGTTGGAAPPAQGQAGGSAAGGQDYGDKGTLPLFLLPALFAVDIRLVKSYGIGSR